ncbi:general secretion pathway protein D [Sulfuricaulis limicola]|uniref:General secretion pathway protein D n=1 Tax=Sulfuricaulis limicola TaxID=1620215 RepID=A0A1B4XGF5_9GAMM|nr:type II secretion system secretin GspD [Sulfuricaulis limicola]BAV33859.1 general secretion pathway protein D [Sulfuricaulis limicola]
MADSRNSLAVHLAALALGILLATPLSTHAQDQADEAEMNAPPMPAAPSPPLNGGSHPASPLTPMGAAPAPRPAPPMPPSRPSSVTPTVTAPAGPALRPGEMMFNFQEADIQAVVKTVSQITGKNFLLDPRVKGKLTIISTQPVSRKAIYQIFLASLKAQGYTAIDSASGFVKLVPIADAKQNADVTTGMMPRPGEQTMTHVITVQHSSAAQLVPLLRPLMAPTSQLSVYSPSNTLIVTDYADNIRNLLRIVEIIDQRGGAELAIIPLKYASALDIADMVVRLYPNVSQSPGTPGPAQAAGGEADRVTILPDLRTNSLLVRAENQGAIKDLREFVEKLDVPAKVSGNTRVVYLRNAEATKLAEILRGLLTGEARAQTTAAVVPGRPAATKSGAESSQIQADESTNSLVISAPDAVFNNLRAVIEKLDVRRAQVYVEALIAEITTDKASQFGFQWAAGAQSGSGTVGGLTNFPNSGTSIVGVATNPTSLGSAGGLSLAYLGRKITLSDGTEVRSLGALARALEEKSIGNILSTPNLLTLDNAEAKIVVGQNVPFVTGSFSQATSTSGTVNPFQTIERKDVGLTLKIKPQISEGGTVKLQISQESSSVAQATGVQASDLITNKRSLETTVVVDDGNTIVLGGLIEDSARENTQAVPFLGRIPLLGWLFKYRTETKTKTNLMVFLRPVIVRGPEDSYGFSSSRYSHINAEQKKISNQPAPILEDFKPREPLPPGPTESKKDARITEEIPSDKTFGPPNVPDATSPSDRASP